MKPSILILPILLTVTAVAESTFIMASGFGDSSDRSEATAKAIDQAETNLDNKCDGGRVRNIQTSISCNRSGSSEFGYTYSGTATKSAQCEKQGDEDR